MEHLSYLIYFSLYSLISYKTNFGFAYTNGFELFWGSILSTLISGAIANIIFHISYNLARWCSVICDYTKEERKTTHWKFRMWFSLLVFGFSMTPLCSMWMTPLVNTSYNYIVLQLNNLLQDIYSQIIGIFN